MADEDLKIEIARMVCSRFVNTREPTSRFPLVTKCESPVLLDRMEHNGLLHASNEA